MADEIVFSSLSDATVAATLHQEILLKMGDRASLWGHPALAYIGSVNGTGSNVKKAAIWGLDLAPMTSPSEGAAVANSAISGYTSSVSVTVARQAIAWAPSDLSAMTWGVGASGLIERISTDVVGSAKRRFQSLLCDITDGFTSTVGSSGVDFSVTNLFSALAILQNASAEGPFLGILHPVQLSDLQASLRSETGALAFHTATPEMMALKGQGFAGHYLGVDFYQSSLVPTANAGADRAGCIMARGAVAYADGLPSPQVGLGGMSIATGPIFVELERDGAANTTKVIGNYYVGLAKAQDGMGVSLITDA
jgi:hypothetical protein